MNQIFVINDTYSEVYSINITQLDAVLFKRLLQQTNLSFTESNDGKNFRIIEQCEECNWFVQDFTQRYANTYHGYVALAVCLFGTIANILNVAVLTRKDMACAPINRILTGLAVADMTVMIEYMTFAYYYYLELPGKKDFPYAGAVFVLFHTHFTQTMHTISICLTLTLAIWRYLAIG